MFAALLADDLTGAMDAGVQWTRSVPDAAVVWTLPLPENRPALVLTSESRNLPAAEAAARVRSAYEALLSGGYRLVYKKTDSTMRGHIGTEIRTLLSFGKHRFALLCPALPAGGRSVKNGILYVGGEPLLSSDIAKDPYSRITCSSIPELLVRDADLSAAVFPCDETLPGALRSFTGDVAVVDAETEEDLAFVASCLDDSILPCGSAGLFGAICRLRQEPARPVPAGTGAGPLPRLLTLCGSPALKSREQMQAAANAGFLLRSLTESCAASTLKECRLALGKGNSVILDAAGSTKEELSLLYADDARGLQKAGARVQALLREAALQLAGSADGICVFGGDSALSILSTLRADGILLRGEAQPLVPWGTLLGGPNEGLFFSTKAGGLGNTQVIPDVRLALSRLLCSRKG
ncbi:MAG: four-carbon acid sugar kinase family protein [Clostridia bacterium]|nr:four-carbon acid sugar kinase family protein [Clostridia bacterium]